MNQYPFPFDHRFGWNTARLLRGHQIFLDIISKWLDDMKLNYMKFTEMPEFGIETKFKLSPRNQRQPEQGKDIIEELISSDAPDVDDERNQDVNEAEQLVNVSPITFEESAANRSENQVTIPNAVLGWGSINPAEPNDIDIEVNIKSNDNQSVQPNATSATEGAQAPAVEQMEIDIDIDVNIEGNQANVPNYNNAADFQAILIDPNVPLVRRPFLPRPRRNLPQQDNGDDPFQVDPPQIQYRRRNRRNRRNQNFRPVCI